ncbi:MAG: hypothetical protein JMN24_14455 [gamma proteobacterium endosymbiont of Lamellibrachia anaximandri]|nr:hypothetical protein [gamma proteobacterium endosymbiont of Lamellibrachia anaximandri]MBL3616399.1 hypothetical protein [gamma proteobacterium endosymbiont of Lamellibrachia anaximandri]
MKKRIIGAASLVLLLASSNLFADVLKNDRFNLRLGGFFVTNTEATISFVSPALAGISINTTRDLSMNDTTNVFRLDGYYRFTEQSSIDFSYYRVNRDGSTVLDTEIHWGGNIYPINANLDSSLNTDTYKIAYVWSFHHDEKVELGLSAGLHITSFNVKLKGTLNDITIHNDSNSATAPLPVVGFKLNYNITPKLIWMNKLELFYIKIDSFKGNFSDFMTALEYRAFDNIGFGVGLNSINSDLELEEGDGLLSLDTTNLGALAYASIYF